MLFHLFVGVVLKRARRKTGQRQRVRYRTPEQYSANVLGSDGKSHTFGVTGSGRCGLCISQQDFSGNSKCRLKGSAKSCAHESGGRRKRQSERQGCCCYTVNHRKRPGWY